MIDEAAVTPPIDTTPTDAQAEPAQKDSALDARASQPTQKDTPPKRFKVKIDQEELEVEENELIAGYQRASAASKRMQEAAALRKQAKDDYAAFLRDPFRVLEEKLAPHFGKERVQQHIRALAQKQLQELMEEEQLPESDRRALHAERRARELEEKLREAEERKAEEARAVEIQRHQDQFTKNLQKAIDGAGFSLEPGKKGYEQLDTEDLNVLINMLSSAIESDYDLTPEEAVDNLREAREARRKRYFESLSDDEILKDEARAKRLNEVLLKKALEASKSQSSTQKSAGKSPTGERRASEKRSTSDFFNNW